MIKKEIIQCPRVRHVSQCCSLCYSFSFSHKIMSRPSWFEFTTAVLRVVHISLRSLHHVQYVRLLLLYSVIFQCVIFQSCKFQSCKFSYPIRITRSGQATHVCEVMILAWVHCVIIVTWDDVAADHMKHAAVTVGRSVVNGQQTRLVGDNDATTGRD